MRKTYIWYYGVYVNVIIQIMMADGGKIRQYAAYQLIYSTN